MTQLIEFKDVKNILIIKLRHIGDVLLTIPAIRAVRERFPDACIVALVNKGTEEMLTENPLLDAVMTFDRGILKLPIHKRLMNEIAFARKIRAMGFDLTIDLTAGDRPAIYSYISGARYRIAYDPGKKGFWGKSYLYTHLGKRTEGRNHMVLENLNLVRQFGIDADNLSVNMFFSDRDRQYVDELLSKNGLKPSTPLIHLHPTSRWIFKCWRDESMAEIIDFCEDSMNTRIVITSSSDRREMDKIKCIMDHVKSSPINLSGMLTLKQLAALSQRASLFFGVDSAPMHIAAAVGTPVVALFGPTGAFNWGPWGNNQKSEVRSQKSEKIPYPERNGMQRSEPHTVIQRDWDCIPCGEDGCKGSKISDCLEDIGVDEVKKIIERYLESFKKH